MENNQWFDREDLTPFWPFSSSLIGWLSCKNVSVLYSDYSSSRRGNKPMPKMAISQAARLTRDIG